MTLNHSKTVAFYVVMHIKYYDEKELTCDQYVQINYAVWIVVSNMLLL